MFRERSIPLSRVVVLSNNDGYVVACSDEAKALGIKMAVPFFQLADLRQQHDLQVLSSNHTLHGDMSARVMAILGRFVEEVEVYSIDEAFLSLRDYESVYPDHALLAADVRRTVDQWTRTPYTRIRRHCANQDALQSG